jgi:hypothetical protein
VVRSVVLVVLVTACSFDPHPPSGLTNTDAAPKLDGSTPGLDAPVNADAPFGAEAGNPITGDFPITSDTYVDSLNANTPFGIAIAVLADGGGSPASVLWRADLSAIPTTALVTAAELHIWTSNDSGGPCDIVEMLERWDEAAATWNERAVATPWASVGATPPARGTTPIGAPIPVTPTLTEVIVTLDTAVITKWVAQPAANLGAAIVDTTSDGANYRSREHTMVTNRPFLRITY